MSSLTFTPTPAPADAPVVTVPKYHVRLEKNTKGYNWEISVRSDDPQEVMREVQRINQELRTQYGTA